MNEFKKLSDAEWVNVVNHPLVIGCGGGRAAEDAVYAAFKLIEEKLYEKNQPILEALHSRVEALEKDAARYRWLRKNWFTMAASYENNSIHFYTGGKRYSSANESLLDATIDTTMQSEKGENK